MSAGDVRRRLFPAEYTALGLDSKFDQAYLSVMVLLRKRSLVGFIEPCLPSPAKAPPSGPGWIHEIKHDGFRIMARRDGEDDFS